MATAVAVADDPAVVELRTCKLCTETKPITEFVKTTRAGTHPRYLHKCRRCRAVERSAEYHQRRVAGDPRLSSSTQREKLARTRAAYGHRHVEEAPDPEIPGLLRELLADSRRVGMGFSEAWPDDVAFVLARIRARPGGIEAERESWRQVFEATRANWQAAYNRAAGPDCRLDPALADEPTGERPTYAVIG